MLWNELLSRGKRASRGEATVLTARQKRRTGFFDASCSLNQQGGWRNLEKGRTKEAHLLLLCVLEANTSAQKEAATVAARIHWKQKLFPLRLVLSGVQVTSLDSGASSGEEHNCQVFGATSKLGRGTSKFPGAGNAPRSPAYE